MKAALLGLLASFFFAFSFVLNRMMSISGGNWVWSASLRYFFMLPILLLIVGFRRDLGSLFTHMRRRPLQWLVWSTVGFGLFYAPLCFSSAYSPAWLVAGTWQFTIIAGSLLAPFFYDTIPTPSGVAKVRKKIPVKGLAVSTLILIGIALMEWQVSGHESISTMIMGVLPVIVASFAYPLGNRKMMDLCGDQLDAYQRVLGMTIASLPFWLLLASFGIAKVGPPSANQLVQTLMVGVFSGVIATVLFFKATNMTEGNVHQLAAVEATQSGEVVFTILGEFLLIPDTRISNVGMIGIGIVLLGMATHNFVSGGTRISITEDESEKI